jgi:hypothetical protein
VRYGGRRLKPEERTEVRRLLALIRDAELPQ